MNKVINLNNDTTIQALRKLFAFLEGILSEKAYRLLLGAVAIFLGRGGVTFLHEVAGASKGRICRGKQEIEEDDEIIHSHRVRREGGGRKPKEHHEPKLRETVEDVLERSSYGDPASAKERIWSTVSLVGIQAHLLAAGISACARTVLRVVRDLGYTKQRNRKLLPVGKPHPDRNEQMELIAEIRNPVKSGSRRGERKNPVLSIDTKAKVVVGNLQQAGAEYRKKKDARKVEDHDFVRPGDRLPPYGIYDVMLDMGFVALGVSRDTAQFAAQALRTWWPDFGKVLYPDADRIVLLCDGGGSNGCRTRLWKLELARLAEEIGLPVEVHHYPPGCSKHNPIEHRLFNHISLNWAGKPLIDPQTILGFIAATTSSTGLIVRAWLDERTYEKGIKVSDAEFACIDIHRHDRLGLWNYTIRGLLNADAVSPC